MVNKAKGRLYKRADGMYFIYLPKSLAEDSAFPFPILEGNKGVDLEVHFKGGKLIAQKITPESNSSK